MREERREREKERERERGNNLQRTNQEVHHCVCHSLFIYPQQPRLLARCIPSAKHTQCLDVLDRSHGRCTEPRHSKQPTQPSQNADYHEVKVVASSLFETVFCFVHQYDRELVLNKDKYTHLKWCGDERRREEERGGGGRRERRERWEGAERRGGSGRREKGKRGRRR